LTGSLIGGVSTLTASWLSQRGQFRAQALVHEAVKRETLYAEFIIEASKRLTEAWSRQAESPEVIAGLYSALDRMRLTSSTEVIRVAEQVVRQVLEAYAEANKSFDELRELVRKEDEFDPLRDFAEACRTELRALRV
jgi:prephenate dehydrogenase